MESRRTTATPRQAEPAPTRETAPPQVEPQNTSETPSPTQDEADALKQHAVGLGEGGDQGGSGPEPESPTAPTNVDVPQVSGTATVGSTLSCTMGNWNGEPLSYAYQWKRDGSTDVGTGGDSYVIVAADAGHNLGCVVTATNAAGSSAAPSSNSLAVPAA